MQGNEKLRNNLVFGLVFTSINRPCSAPDYEKCNLACVVVGGGSVAVMCALHMCGRTIDLIATHNFDMHFEIRYAARRHGQQYKHVRRHMCDAHMHALDCSEQAKQLH